MDYSFNDNTLPSNNDSLKGKLAFYSKKQVSIYTYFIHSFIQYQLMNSYIIIPILFSGL